MKIMSNINVHFKHAYVHVPKTAGVSMERMHFVGGSGHLNFHFLTEDPKFDPDFFTWAFVRNPYDRLASAYFYIKQRHAAQYHNQISDPDGTFESFVLNLKDSIKNDIYNERIHQDHQTMIHLYSQSYFIKSDEFPMDFIGRFEDLAREWVKAVKRIGIRTGKRDKSWGNLGHKNKTFNKPNYAEEYTPEMKEVVYDIYREDFDTFNYPK